MDSVLSGVKPGFCEGVSSVESEINNVSVKFITVDDELFCVIFISGPTSVNRDLDALPTLRDFHFENCCSFIVCNEIMQQSTFYVMHEGEDCDTVNPELVVESSFRVNKGTSLSKILTQCKLIRCRNPSYRKSSLYVSTEENRMFMVSGKIDACFHTFFPYNEEENITVYVHCDDNDQDEVKFPDAGRWVLSSKRRWNSVWWCESNSTMYSLVSFNYRKAGRFGEALELCLREIAAFVKEQSKYVRVFCYCKSGKDRSPRAYLLLRKLLSYDDSESMRVRYSMSGIPRLEFREIELYNDLFDKFDRE